MFQSVAPAPDEGCGAGPLHGDTKSSHVSFSSHKATNAMNHRRLTKVSSSNPSYCPKPPS